MDCMVAVVVCCCVGVDAGIVELIVDLIVVDDDVVGVVSLKDRDTGQVGQEIILILFDFNFFFLDCLGDTFLFVVVSELDGLVFFVDGWISFMSILVQAVEAIDFCFNSIAANNETHHASNCSFLLGLQGEPSIL